MKDLNILVLGERKAGKTTFIQRFVYGDYNPNYIPTQNGTKSSTTYTDKNQKEIRNLIFTESSNLGTDLTKFDYFILINLNGTESVFTKLSEKKKGILIKNTKKLLTHPDSYVESVCKLEYGNDFKFGELPAKNSPLCSGC